MDFSDIIFRRKFSMPMFRNLRINLGEMSFSKDFISEAALGDPYPIIENSPDYDEYIFENRYHLKGGKVCRWFSEFFPHASYELIAEIIDGKAGFSLALSNTKAEILFDKNIIYFSCGDVSEVHPCPQLSGDVIDVVVSCEPYYFSVYLRLNGELSHIVSFETQAFADSHNYTLFSKGYAAVYSEGKVIISKALSYLDNGVSQADMKPIRYENGDIMLDSGKVYITLSLRQQFGGYQGIYSWVPGTAEIEMCGAIFYDIGDGRWCGDIASSVLFNRKTKQWYIWYASFNHGHILGHAVVDNEIRFGINVIDAKLMPVLDTEDRRSFSGFGSDEDPDFFYDEKVDKWYMAICRQDPEIGRYKYHFFESDKPFEDYRFIGKGVDGSETGGSFVNIDSERHFVCGNGFRVTSNYRIYSKDGVQDAVFDYPDGGYRGWGTLMPIKHGSRTRYYWWTFDRHNGGTGNWTYGNLYCYEADLYIK